jgi:hypothetical protein
LDLRRHLGPVAVLAGQQRVGLAVVRKALEGGVEGQHAAEAVGDVGPPTLRDRSGAVTDSRMVR